MKTAFCFMSFPMVKIISVVNDIFLITQSLKQNQVQSARS